MKKWYESKTLWTAIITGTASIGVAIIEGADLSTVATLAMSLVFGLLRLITRAPIGDKALSYNSDLYKVAPLKEWPEPTSDED